METGMEGGESSIVMTEKLGLQDPSLLTSSTWQTLSQPHSSPMASGSHAALYPEQVAPGHRDNEPLHLRQRIQLWILLLSTPVSVWGQVHTYRAFWEK